MDAGVAGRAGQRKPIELMVPVVSGARRSTAPPVSFKEQKVEQRWRK